MKRSQVLGQVLHANTHPHFRRQHVKNKFGLPQCFNAATQNQLSPTLFSRRKEMKEGLKKKMPSIKQQKTEESQCCLWWQGWQPWLKACGVETGDWPNSRDWTHCWNRDRGSLNCPAELTSTHFRELSQVLTSSLTPPCTVSFMITSKGCKSSDNYACLWGTGGPLPWRLSPQMYKCHMKDVPFLSL